MKDSHATSKARSPICPLCELGELVSSGHNSARCDSCGCSPGTAVLKTLLQIANLPDVAGHHACECGHPQMRRLPDGVFRCPACHAEVLPVTLGVVPPKPKHHGKAYWSGWLDGRFGDGRCFTENERLKQWEDGPDRLDYYRGHRAGSADRQARTDSPPKAA